MEKIDNVDYIVFNNQKIIIKRVNRNKKYYKEVKGKLEELSSQEVTEIKLLFQKKSSSIYYQENLKDLILSNDTFKDKGDYIMPFLKFLELVIPPQYRNNFYNNIKTLKLEIEMEPTEKKVKEKTGFYSQVAGYNPFLNEIIVENSAIEELREISKKTSNPESFFWLELNSAVLHELTHMASSKCDLNKKVVFCGFDINPPQEKGSSNRGLTEGMTEIITMTGIPNSIEISSGYYLECLLINQLMLILNPQVLLESYFGNLGVEELEKKLKEIIPNSEKAKILFQRIEDNFNIRDSDCQQTILSNIQMSLMDYFLEKINGDLNKEQIDYKQLEETIKKYKNYLVTPSILSKMHINPSNYPYLEESIKRFEKFHQNFQNLGKGENKVR